MQTMNSLLQHHAHLWIGNNTKLAEIVVCNLQQIFCKTGGCQHCAICNAIVEHQYHGIDWLEPDGSYTLDQIDEILSKVRFKLNTNEHRFFIFTKADELSANCNNRLLKTIEEPHPGYIFIFLTSRTDTILPTLISRCFVKNFDNNQISYAYQEIMQPFMNNNFTQPLDFIKLIDKHEIKERETRDVIDELITFFHGQLIKVHKLHVTNAPEIMIAITKKIVLLKNALKELPVQGSAKMFWKNLYMTFHEQQ